MAIEFKFTQNQLSTEVDLGLNVTSVANPNRVVITSPSGYLTASDVTYNQLVALLDSTDEFASIHNQDLIIQDAKFSISDSGHIGGYGLTETYVSPVIQGHQGYATDGTYHYVIDTGALYKHNDDPTWSLALSNLSPFTGMVGPVSHIGDGDVYNGVLYVPVENFISLSLGGTNHNLCKFDANTLTLISQVNVDAYLTGIDGFAGVAIDGLNNLLYTVGYFTGDKISMFDATTLAFIGSFNLSRSLGRGIQGIAFANNKLYLASDREGLFTCEIGTGELTLVKPNLASYTVPEGIAVVGDEVRWLIDNIGSGQSNVHYFIPDTTKVGFYTDKTGLSYFSGQLRTDNNVSFWTNTIDRGSIHTATKRGYSSALYMESADPSNTGLVIGSLGHDNANTFISRNAEFVEGNWFRPDVTKNSLAYLLNSSSNRHEWRTSVAASGVITWTTPMILNTDGSLNLLSNIGTQNVVTIRNTNSGGASSTVYSDDANTKTFGTGIKNTASTLDASFGAIGEGYIRAGGSPIGLAISATAGNIRFLTTTSGTERGRFFNNGNFIIGGTTDGGFKADIQGTTRIQNTLDVYGGSGSTPYLLNGSDSSSATLRTNATDKAGRLALPHFLTAEEPMAIYLANSTTSANTLNFGGGSGVMNAITQLNFYTASNNTTLTGSVRMTIGSDGSLIHAGDRSGTPLNAIGINSSGKFVNMNTSIKAIRTITATASALVTDYTILCDATSGAITVNLPAVATVSGQIIIIKKINNTANNITIDPSGAETIDTAATLVISTFNQSVMIQSNGTTWSVLSLS